MKIETKYNIGDTVYVSDNGMPSKRAIGGINVLVGDNGKADVYYSTVDFALGTDGMYRHDETFSEGELHASAREIIAKKIEKVQSQISELQKKIDILAGLMEEGK